MQHHQRRVKKLRLSSNSESTLSCDLMALQDAFNIASLNGVPPNGLLLIRRLELDRLSPRASAHSISDIIDKKVRNLCYQAVCVDEQDAMHANIVWFSDALNAATRFLDMVVRRTPVNAWYWRVLFRGYKPDMSLSDVLILVSREAEHKHSSLALMAAVIQNQVEKREIEKTLEAITPRLARTLLSEGGFYPHAIDTVGNDYVYPSATISFSTAWKQTLKHCLLRWGYDDVRTRWMAVNALVNQNPALLDSGRLLMLEADSLVQQFQPGVQSSRSHTQGVSNDNDNTCETGNHKQEPKNHKHSHLSNDSKQKSLQASAQNINSSTSPPEKTSVDSGNNVTPSGESNDGRGAYSQFINSPQENDTALTHADGFYGDTIDTTTESAEKDAEIPLNGMSDSANHSCIANAHTESVQFKAAHYNPRSGFLFVVSILQALNMDECLKLNPALAIHNLPVRIIRRLAQSFGIDQAHPLMQCIPDFASQNETIESFVCPPLWVELLALRSHDPLTLHRYASASHSKHCLITDHHHKLVLFAGDIHLVPEWADHHTVVIKNSHHRLPELADIETTVILLMNRFLHRYASSTLTGLIERPGSIAHTCTHVDVIFDPDQIDSDIRRAGLDIDPGWVSWLGRVLQYHYVSGVLNDDG